MVNLATMGQNRYTRMVPSRAAPGLSTPTLWFRDGRGPVPYERARSGVNGSGTGIMVVLLDTPFSPSEHVDVAVLKGRIAC